MRILSVSNDTSGGRRTPPSALGESSFRVRRYRGSKFFTHRSVFDGLAVVVTRYPARRTAPAEGRSYVLVHGIGMSSRYYRPLAIELARFGEVYVVDLPGYGASSNPRRSVNVGDHAAALASAIEDIGLVNPVIVGHSMGTQVVSRLAVDHPDITDRIVLIAPTMDPKSRSLLTASARLALDTLREPVRTNAVVLTDYFVRCGLPYYLRQLPLLFVDHMEDRLPRITARTLVIRGDRDRVSPEDWTRRVADLIPDSTFVTVAGPHVVMYTDTVSLAARLAEHAKPALRPADGV